MALLARLFKLIPPTFKAGYCPSSLQQFANDLFSGAQVTVLVNTGNFQFNYGSTTPSPENRIYPWLHVPSGRWYTFQFGLWVSPMDGASREPSFRKMWFPAAGTPESNLWGLDGGDGTDPATNAPTAISGAAWQVDTVLSGRIPIGVGTVAGSDPAVTLAVRDTDGDAQFTQTSAQVPPHKHIVPICVNANQVTDPSPGNSPGCVKFGVGEEIGTGNIVDDSTGTFDRAYPMTSSTEEPVAADAPEQEPISLLPPVIGVIWIKPTAKIWYTLPA